MTFPATESSFAAFLCVHQLAGDWCGAPMACVRYINCTRRAWKVDAVSFLIA
jgi:hypothetical protein